MNIYFIHHLINVGHFSTINRIQRFRMVQILTEIIYME